MAQQGPGYGSQPHIQHGAPQQSHAPMPAAAPAGDGGGIGAAAKANRPLAIALICFGVALLFNWILRAFQVTDDDARPFLRATVTLFAAGGFGALLAQSFAVVTTRPKQPTFGQVLLCIVILILVALLVAAGSIRL